MLSENKTRIENKSVGTDKKCFIFYFEEPNEQISTEQN